MNAVAGTACLYRPGPWRATGFRALVIVAAAAVVATATRLWRGTTAYDWRLAGSGTLGRAKLLAGVPYRSEQNYEWTAGSVRRMPLAAIATDPMIDWTGERIVRIAGKHTVLGSGIGAAATAAAGLILLTIAWRHTGMAGRLRRRLWPLAAHPAVRALPGLRRRMRWIGRAPFPPGADAHHIMVSGAAGPGRTALVADLLRQARGRGERCIVHDPRVLAADSLRVLLGSATPRLPPERVDNSVVGTRQR